MALEGKKINELDSISILTEQTVIPAVYISGDTASTTAGKITIEQIKDISQADIYNKTQVNNLLDKKQNTLTAGSNITIEEDSDENLVISADVDSSLSSTSENPVQNKVIYEAIGDIETILHTLNTGDSDESI